MGHADLVFDGGMLEIFVAWKVGSLETVSCLKLSLGIFNILTRVFMVSLSVTIWGFGKKLKH